MSLTAKKDPDSGGSFKLVPEGTHIAICNQIIDLGWQTSEWKGVEKNLPKCYIRWELPSERIEWTDKDEVEHEGPMSIGKTYTVGLGEKYNMRKDFEGWRGKAFTTTEEAGFAIKNVLGTSCQVSVTHKTNPSTGNQYARVESIVALPKGMDVPEPENSLFYYDDESGNYDDLPNWAKEKIESQPVAPQQEEDNVDDFDDDIPF